MKVHKGMWCAGVMTLAMAGASQMAQASVEESADVPQEERELVQQCHDAAMASKDRDTFESSQLLMDQQNAGDYEKGEELLLHINMLGHGTTIYNVSCNVDEQGNVTYEEYKEAGTPAGSTR
ncbi:hypothetical protein GCM10010082_18810 [Kushneria pakistanensis]|uniref:Uncharacterized protein n=1 Tax=Kushneria pakistanensis TaxID=1508770 RepID=A0ABQ3FJE7_9GAMM|nr:hypothetical protein [Kushneria pakistanensis]GHC25998.1 hypothetical protein GCM10010082_18810 [Kushneria pakistanensis]